MDIDTGAETSSLKRIRMHVLGRIITRQVAPTVYGTNNYFTTKIILTDRLYSCQDYLLTFTLEESTFTDGPIVVVMLTDFMYVPLAAAGLAF